MIVAAAAVVAFVNVNVIPMDRERVENAQTVIVRDDRIVSIGPVRDVRPGSFVHEPRVNSPDEMRREIVSQVREGYDLIKFHELFDTTTGLSLPAYLTMIETARDQNVPLVGHSPVNLGWDVLLQVRQPLGVMVRGNWLTRDRWQQMLNALVSKR